MTGNRSKKRLKKQNKLPSKKSSVPKKDKIIWIGIIIIIVLVILFFLFLLFLKYFIAID